MRKTLVLISLIALLAGVFAATITSDNTVGGVTIVPKYNSATGGWDEVTFTISGCTNVKWFTPTADERHVHIVGVDTGNTFKWDGMDRRFSEAEVVFSKPTEIYAICDGVTVWFDGIYLGTPYRLMTPNACSAAGGTTHNMVSSTEALCEFSFKFSDFKTEKLAISTGYNAYINTPHFLTNAYAYCGSVEKSNVEKDEQGNYKPVDEVNTGYTTTRSDEHSFALVLDDDRDYECLIGAAYEGKTWFHYFDLNTKASANPTCTDTDDINQYTKGTVTTDSTTLTDNCFYDSTTQKTALMEYMCNNDGTYDTLIYDCPNGCSQGACYTNTNKPDTGAPTKPLTISAKYETANELTIRCSGSTDPEGDTIKYQLGAYFDGSWKDYESEFAQGYYKLNVLTLDDIKKVRCRAYDTSANYGPYAEIAVSLDDLVISNLDYNYERIPNTFTYKLTVDWNTNIFARSSIKCEAKKPDGTDYNDITEADGFETADYKKRQEFTPSDAFGRGKWTCRAASYEQVEGGVADEEFSFELLKNTAPSITALKINGVASTALTDSSKTRGGQNEKFTISCDADDPDNNPVWYDIETYDADNGWKAVVSSGTHTGGGNWGSYTWDISSLKSQTDAKVRCKASDSLDTTDWVTASGLIIDHDVPTITITRHDVNILNLANVDITASEPVTLWMNCAGDTPIQRNIAKTTHTIFWKHTAPPTQVDTSNLGASNTGDSGGDSLTAKKFNCDLEVYDSVMNTAKKTITVEPSSTGSISIGGGASGTGSGGRLQPGGGSMTKFGFKSGGVFIDQNWLDLLQLALLAAMFVFIVLGAKTSTKGVVR